MSKKPRITARLPPQPTTPAGMAYARTEAPHTVGAGQGAGGQLASDTCPKASTKRQIYVLEVDQIGWVKRLALELFVASEGSDPGQSAIVRAILRGVMESGVDLSARASTPDEVRGFIRERLLGAE